jgi:hypothetical protein
MQLTSLDAVDVLTSAAVTISAPNSANFSLAQAIGTVSSSDNNPDATLLLSPSNNQRVLAFRVRASNDSVKLYNVMFT